MASVLHKELEYKVEKLQYKKLEVTQPRIKNNPNFHLVNKPFRISPQEVIIRGGGVGEGGGLNRGEGLLTFFPWKKGALIKGRGLIWKGGGLIGDLPYSLNFI